MKKSRKKLVNNELRTLIIATMMFVFLVPVGFLVIITVQDDHAQENFSSELDDVVVPENIGDAPTNTTDETTPEASSDEQSEEPAVEEAATEAATESPTEAATEAALSDNATEVAPTPAD